MPPRIPTPSLQAELSSLASYSSSSVAHSASPLERALLSCQSPAFPSTSRSFSTSTSRKRNVPLAKARFITWMKRRGKDLEKHTPGTPNYLEPEKLQPFPSNPAFKSHRVLSEEARESIFQRVFFEDEPMKLVSSDLGVDLRRVAAVVRMKTIEREWLDQGKKLANPYSRAIMEMLPQYRLEDKEPLEPINEIHVHGYTMQQLFVPTSESRHFTREDAAKAFHNTMLSPDDRIPHKELVEYHRRVKDGMRERDSRKVFIEEAAASQKADEARDAEVVNRDKRITTTIPTARFEFRIKKMTVDDVGRDGRARSGVGWRYGIPYEDRKKNQVKIRTKID